MFVFKYRTNVDTSMSQSGLVQDLFYFKFKLINQNNYLIHFKIIETIHLFFTTKILSLYIVGLHERN